MDSFDRHHERVALIGGKALRFGQAELSTSHWMEPVLGSSAIIPVGELADPTYKLCPS